MKKALMAKLKRFRDIRAELDPKLLCLLWFVGACIVGTSIFATHIVTMNVVQGLEKVDIGNHVTDNQEQMTVTIYSAPAPFEGSVGIQQAVAINSWLRLNPCPNVVLLGQHPSLRVFASNRAPNVTVDTDIDFTFSGKPLFHGMVRRALSCSSDIVMLIDPDVILLRHVFRAIQNTRSIDQDWLVTALPRVVADFPFSLQGKKFESGAYVDEEVEAYVRENGIWDTCDGAQLWAWNGSQRPLHAGVMPVFTYKEGYHNHWLLSEAISSKYRAVLDASEAFSAFRTQRAGNKPYDTSDISVARTTTGNRISPFGNLWLASTYGSFHFKSYNFSEISLKLLNCGGMPSERFCMVNVSQHPCSCSPLSRQLTREMGTSPLFYHPRTWTSWFGALTGGGLARPWYKKNQGINCGCHSLLYRNNFQCVDSKLLGWQRGEFDFSDSLESLVRRVASDDKVVILAVVGNSYRDMLMSWICRLKHLQISNYMVSALDDDLFYFASQQGLPVFRNSVDMNVSRDDCHFGTTCFQKVTKMKSRTVLQILQLGFHVLFSDVDIYWFEDPLNELMSFGPGHLPAQTDQWNETEALNTPRHLNSGFYFAWADNLTVAAFQSIIKHGATSGKSEQPSFYDVLCGEEGKYRAGVDICLNPMLNVTVHFLDPVKYPNGAFGSLWEKKNVRSACKAQGCKILHNNWVPGRQKKIFRQTTSGLWDYDAATRLCTNTKSLF